MPGKVAAFAQYGIKLKNDRNSWSGRNEDARIVAIVLWEDEISEENGKIVYDCFGKKSLLEDGKRPENTIRKADIAWALENCEKRFRVVIGKVSKNEDKKAGKATYDIDKDLVMEITNFKQSTGEFRAESIS